MIEICEDFILTWIMYLGNFASVLTWKLLLLLLFLNMFYNGKIDSAQSIVINSKILEFVINNKWLVIINCIF